MFETLLGRTILSDDLFTQSENLICLQLDLIKHQQVSYLLLWIKMATLIGNTEVNNLLKSFAPQLLINIERKEIQPYTIPRYLSKMLFTNNEAPIKIEDGDRR